MEGRHVGYSEVTQVKNGQLAGATVYRYENGTSDYQRAFLPSETDYDAQNRRMRETVNEYAQLVPAGPLFGYSVPM